LSAIGPDLFADARLIVRAGPERLRRLAILAAILLHLAVAASLLAPLHRAEPQPPPPIPVTLILKPAAAVPPSSRELWRSGPNERTASPLPSAPVPEAPSPFPAAPPPPAAKPAPAEEPLPAPHEPHPVAVIEAPPPAPEAHEEAVPIPQPKPTPTAAPAEERTVHIPPKPAEKPRPRVASRATAPPPMPHDPTVPRELEGDPYLNAAYDKVMRNMSYPPLARSLGLSGIVVLNLTIDRGGQLLEMSVQRSSGAEILDRAAEDSVRRSAPFGPPPAEIPGPKVGLFLVLRVGPS